jgi:hypothetical protein
MIYNILRIFIQHTKKETIQIQKVKQQLPGVNTCYYSQPPLSLKNIRERLHELINKKNNLKDPEIINMSKKIDLLLNEYEKVIIERNKSNN